MRQKKNRQNKIGIVVDTDIVRAASDDMSNNDNKITAKQCSLFLLTMQEQKLELVFSQQIYEEWKKKRENEKQYMSCFSANWLASMYARKLVRNVTPQQSGLKDKVLQEFKLEEEKSDVSKDFHLIEAALAADKTIASCNDKERDKFKQVSIEQIKNIVWRNPKDEDVIEWLKEGAPPKDEYKLGFILKTERNMKLYFQKTGQ